MTGQTCVITGASDGIGRAVAHALAVAGAHVIMVGRNDAKTAAAARSIMSATGSRTVEWDTADLLRQDGVRELAERLHAKYPAVHVLVNNAGALFMDRQLTIDGLERTFALNHLAYFSLSLLMLRSLSNASSPDNPSRIVCVASRAHRKAQLKIDDLQMERGFHSWRAYGNSKLANILFTRSLSARLDPAKLLVHAVHPGLVRTRFAVNNGRRGRWLRRILDLRSVSAEEGADTICWLAMASPQAVGSGRYWVKRAPVLPSAAAQDDVLAEALWQCSTQLSSLDVNELLRRSDAPRARATIVTPSVGA